MQLTYYIIRNAETRKNGTWNTGGRAERPGTVAEQQNTPEHQWNMPRIPTEHQCSTSVEPYNTKINCSVFKGT